MSNMKQSLYEIIDEKDWLNATSKVLIKQKVISRYAIPNTHTSFIVGLIILLFKNVFV